MSASTSKHSGIFFGWWIVGASVVIALYTAGIVNFGFTAVFEPIAKEFGWSYAQISLAASLQGLETGLLAPIVGLLIDRFGLRKILFTGLICIGGGLIFLSRINSLGMFYVAFVIIAIGMSTTTGTVFLTAVVQWFRRRLAMATGVVTCGFALGGLLVPLVTALVDTFGWRLSMVYLGLGVWVITLPLTLIMRHKPEQYGYVQDGIIADEASSEQKRLNCQLCPKILIRLRLSRVEYSGTLP